MRQLCNIAYAVRAEGRDENELRELDAELEAEPGVQPRGVSKNTDALMAAFGMKR